MGKDGREKKLIDEDEDRKGCAGECRRVCDAHWEAWHASTANHRKCVHQHHHYLIDAR